MNQQPSGGKSISMFTGVKVFSATMAHDREMLGDKVMAWIQKNPRRQIVQTVVTQSSDQAFHCLAITVFFSEKAEEARVHE
jgi:hypothetical protein